MKTRLKVLFYFILEFILSLLVLGCILLLITKNTIYNSNFVKEQFKESDYYNNLYTSINDEMSNIVVQAGFDEETLENIYTEKMLNEVIDGIIDSIYSGKDYSVSTEEVKSNLNNNINNYLEKNNIKITDQNALDKFIKNILKIYTDEITISDNVKHAQKIISKTKKMINIGLISCAIITLILIVFIRIYFKETTLAIPIMVSGLILIFGYLLVTTNLTISNIFIWDVKVSELLQHVMFSILNKIKLYGIIFIILGCIDALVNYFIKLFKK